MPVRTRRIIALFCLQLGMVLPSEGQAFYVDGFWSGMSPQQLVFAASAQGLMAQPGADGYLYLGTAYPPRLLSQVAFCGNMLVSYTRNILSDTDYANVLAGIFSAYGSPSGMRFSGDIEPGAASGAFRAIGFTLWAKGADRITMTSYFDWRFYQGELFRQQPASVRFETLNPCNA
ncbi:MAG TPA: hypothetical protein VMU18_00120 [Rhodoblastus sp.]|nr:hypothetical protein [Rhodoblastus sp.]